MSIAQVGQNGLFGISDQRNFSQEYEDGEKVHYYVILCSNWDNDEVECEAATSARDMKDGTGRVVVAGTDFIHVDACISRQIRRQQQQQQQQQQSEGIDTPTVAGEERTFENRGVGLAMTAEGQRQSPSQDKQLDPPPQEVLQGTVGLAPTTLPEAPPNSSQGVLSWLQNQSLETDKQSLEKDNLEASSSSDKNQQQELAPKYDHEGPNELPSEERTSALTEITRTAADLANSIATTPLPSQPGAPMAMNVNNDIASAHLPHQPSARVQAPAGGIASSSIIPQKDQSLSLEASGSSSHPFTNSGALMRGGNIYKAVEDVDRAIQAWHAVAYPDRAAAHTMTKIQSSKRANNISVCKLRRASRVMDCDARIRITRSNNNSTFQIVEVSKRFSTAAVIWQGFHSVAVMLIAKLNFVFKTNLQHSATCDAFIRTIRPKTAAVSAFTSFLSPSERLGAIV